MHKDFHILNWGVSTTTTKTIENLQVTTSWNQEVGEEFEIWIWKILLGRVQKEVRNMLLKARQGKTCVIQWYKSYKTVPCSFPVGARCKEFACQWRRRKRLIVYGECCQIPDLRRRFSFRIRDQAWSLKSFCVVEFY